MAQTYLSRTLQTPVPQSESLNGQVANSAGGYSFPVNDMTRLRRFLILGSEGGSYYTSERKLTLENAKALRNLLSDGRDADVLQEIYDIRVNNRAPKQSTLLFALAVVASEGSVQGRKNAFAMLPTVARTASQLFEFVEYADSLRGWGRGFREGVANWYTSKNPSQLAYQVVKYRNRYNWTHRDVLRKVHPQVVGDLNDVFAWVTQNQMPDVGVENFSFIHAFEIAKTADVKTLVDLIHQHKMTWEMVPSEMLDKAEVWEALSEDMPLTALVRNLATLTRLGVIAPMKLGNIVDRLNQIGHGDGMHPLNVLSAYLTYTSGRGVRGSNTWTPVAQVGDALENAFEQSFASAPQTNKRLYVALDVSGSMGGGNVNGVPNLSPRMAAAAMAMAIVRREPNYYVAAFTSNSGRRSMYSGYDGVNPLGITAKTSLVEACRMTENLPFGGTDCALPMIDATKKKMPVDCFVILTDSETWAGGVHPSEALKKYRKTMGIPNARLAVVAMVSNGFSIADPNDAGMLDIVGFDSAVPQLLADFTEGKV